MSSGGSFVQQTGTICAILVDGIMTNNSVNFKKKIRPLVQEEMPFKDILSGALAALLFSGVKPFVQFE